MNLGVNPSLDISYSTQYAEAAVQDFLKTGLVLITSLMFIKLSTKPTSTQFYGSGASLQNFNSLSDRENIP
jgi:hypothetical protein